MLPSETTDPKHFCFNKDSILQQALENNPDILGVPLPGLGKYENIVQMNKKKNLLTITLKTYHKAMSRRGNLSLVLGRTESRGAPWVKGARQGVDGIVIGMMKRQRGGLVENLLNVQIFGGTIREIRKL